MEGGQLLVAIKVVKNVDSEPDFLSVKTGSATH